MKKHILIITLLTLSTRQTFAAGIIGNGIQELYDEAKSAFPYIMAIVFIISVLMNIGNAISEHSWKPLISGIARFMGIALVASALVAFLISLSV